MTPRPRKLGCKGQTLVEMGIAMLLAAAAAASVFGVLLSVKSGIAKGDTKEQLLYYANLLQEELKPYVTADTTVTTGAPGSPAWHLPTDSCPGASPSCWALAPGQHNVTSELPASLTAAPINATLTYQVSLLPAVNGLSVTQVAITTNWQDKR